jgi:hypothetical protein
MRSIFLALLLIGLAGCAAVPWGPQQNAGLTNVKLDGCGAEEGIDGQMFCGIRVVDGKEKSNVSVRVSKGADGTFTASYEAKDVQAFGGQAIRAEVEAAVAAALTAALPEIAKVMAGALAPARELPQ